VLDLTGQVAVVTGGNGGIGLGMAEGLVDAGADVAIWGRNEDKNAAAAEQLRARAPDRRVVALRCDVADEQQVIDTMATTVDELGRVDACIANAGIGGGGPIVDMPLSEWRRVMAVNLDGVFLTFREAARRMIDQGAGGALVATSSTSAIHGAPVTSNYATSKAGVLAFVRGCAVAWARHGIRVNAVIPGWIRTDMTVGGYADERFRDVTTRRTPVRRWGEPGDFRAVAAYLCDKSNTFHTGDTVVLDGGYTVF
jgi:NAD(P)-dependent dehydrogenase (short-subunit alcohol dehydrogenase family)